MKKNNLLKFFIIPLFITSFVFILGCQDVSLKNTLQTLSINMNKVIKDFESITNIDNKSLIIDDFMDVNNLELISNDVISSNSNLDNYILKITTLNNSIYKTIQTNNIAINTKRQIIGKAHQIKSLCDQCSNDKCGLSESNIDYLEELNSSIMTNTHRAYLSKNEVLNMLNSVQEIKNEYNEFSDKLASRYKSLEASLNARVNNFNNILSDLDLVIYTLSSNFDQSNSYDQLFDEDFSLYTNSESIEEHENKIESKKMFRKNIDSYENAGKDFNGFNRATSPSYNQDNYLNGYGYGYNNPFYGRGYGYGFGGMGGMYGINPYMPYGMPYPYPNINSFGSYKNIDTFKNPFLKDIINNEETNEKELTKNDVVETASIDKNKVTKPSKPIPKPLIPDNNIDKLPGQDKYYDDVIIPPIQTPYNPRTKSQYKHTDNGQSKEFISNNENNPKIKKLIED